MYTLNFDNVDATIEAWQAAGINVEWDGWALMFLTPDRSAERNQYGTYQSGQWGYTSRVEPNSNGSWVVPAKFTKGLLGAAV